MKSFKGRVIAAMDWSGEAVVSHEGFNTLASCQSSALMPTAKKIVVSDQNNKELYKKNITGKALCMPETIGSTTGGMIIQTIAVRDLAPKAWLFSHPIDPLSASGIILSNVWNDAGLIAIDSLGDEFLSAVKDGDKIEIKADGTVSIL